MKKMKKNKEYDYSKEDIVKTLIQVGVSEGDNIFNHSNIGFFGRLKNTNTDEEYYLSFKDAIFEVIGEEGTLVVPTFTYSFCWGNIFDKNKTHSAMGFFA